MGVERTKKLQASKISQLETCVERSSDHVCHVENWKNGKVHERFRSELYLRFNLNYNVLSFQCLVKL